MERNSFNLCLLCSKSANLTCDDFPGYQEFDKFKIYHCSNCNTAYSLPRVNTSSLYNKIYSEGRLAPGYNRYWEYADFVKKVDKPIQYLSNVESTYWAVYKVLSQDKRKKEDIKILEVGSGIGYLTYSLRTEGYNIIGLDVSQIAVSNAVEKFGQYYLCEDVFEFAKNNPNSFDFVILTEVIEHVDNPVSFIETILKLLNPSGKAIVTTPNKSFYPENIIWASDLPPVHYWWFSEDSMKFIARKFDYQVSFLVFSEYYKKNLHSISLNKLNSFDPKPYFDINGKLINNEDVLKKGFYHWLRGIVVSNLHLKNLYYRIFNLFVKEKLVCQERGVVMCSIFFNPE